jgi:hypothetical protein
MQGLRRSEVCWWLRDERRSGLNESLGKPWALTLSIDDPKVVSLRLRMRVCHRTRLQLVANAKRKMNRKRNYAAAVNCLISSRF